MVYFQTIFSFLLDIDFFIHLHSMFFFHTEEITSVSNEIYVKEEPSWSPLECDQVCSVLGITETWTFASCGNIPNLLD